METLLHHITIMTAGFSVLCFLALLVAYQCFLAEMRKNLVSRLACLALLGGLIALQIEHYRYLIDLADPLASRYYALLILIVPPAFYFASRSVLRPDQSPRLLDLLHILPAPLVATLVPVAYVPPIAFLIGAGYSLWVASVAFRVARHDHRLHFERFFFGLFAAGAIVALFVVLALPVLDTGVFVFTYANLIGLSGFLALTALVSFPDLLRDIAEAAERAYASSKLGSVDVEAAVARLESLMNEERVHRDEELRLETLAEQLDLSSHQLSELINTRFGVGFSRYIREKRVSDACRLLLDEPEASVLSISMEAGFRSQSAFYAAFREVEGMTPAAYRSRNQSRDITPDRFQDTDFIDVDRKDTAKG